MAAIGKFFRMVFQHPAEVKKFFVALGTALALLVVLMEDGLTNVEAIAVVLEFMGALGVYALPNGTSRTKQ